MFQPGQSFENIMNRMLSRVPDDIDKREGSVIWDALAPAALEIESLYYALDGVLQETYATTASREYLILRAKERGIYPYPATKSRVKAVFNVNVPLQTRFKTNNGILFKVVQEVNANEKTYIVECMTEGKVGNISNVDLVQVDYVVNLSKARLENIIEYAVDEEDTEHFRRRYFDSFKEQAFGGNIADYKNKVMSISGVGAVRVIPVWAGGGTVKLTILDTNYQKSNSELIEKVQNIIDPRQDGNGFGLAPVGHIVTVDTVKEVEIRIGIQASYINTRFELKKEAITNTINSYLKSLIKSWQDINISIKRVPLMSEILKISNITDITEFEINSRDENLDLKSNEIPKLTEVYEI